MLVPRDLGAPHESGWAWTQIPPASASGWMQESDWQRDGPAPLAQVRPVTGSSLTSAETKVRKFFLESPSSTFLQCSPQQTEALSSGRVVCSLSPMKICRDRDVLNGAGNPCPFTHSCPSFLTLLHPELSSECSLACLPRHCLEWGAQSRAQGSSKK